MLCLDPLFLQLFVLKVKKCPKLHFSYLLVGKEPMLKWILVTYQPTQWYIVAIFSVALKSTFRDGIFRKTEENTWLKVLTFLDRSKHKAFVFRHSEQLTCLYRATVCCDQPYYTSNFAQYEGSYRQLKLCHVCDVFLFPMYVHEFITTLDAFIHIPPKTQQNQIFV